MDIITNLTYKKIPNISFSNFENLFKFMYEEGIQKVYIFNAKWWGLNFKGVNGWYTQDEICEIVKSSMVD